MDMAQRHIDAAFEAHMAAAEVLEQRLGVTPSVYETAQALAVAFGDAMGILAMADVDSSMIVEVNDVARRAYESMVSKIIGKGCAGSMQ